MWEGGGEGTEGEISCRLHHNITLPHTYPHFQVWVKVLSTVPAGDAAPGPGGKPQRVTLSMRDVDQVSEGDGDPDLRGGESIRASGGGRGRVCS